MRANASAAWGEAGTVEVQLPTDKLGTCLQHQGDNADLASVILVNCGSFNPPTIMHLRMLDLGAQVMRKVCSLLPGDANCSCHCFAWTERTDMRLVCAPAIAACYRTDFLSCT